jgi:hypothetical protein
VLLAAAASSDIPDRKTREGPQFENPHSLPTSKNRKIAADNKIGLKMVLFKDGLTSGTDLTDILLFFVGFFNRTIINPKGIDINPKIRTISEKRRISDRLSTSMVQSLIQDCSRQH